MPHRGLVTSTVKAWRASNAILRRGVASRVQLPTDVLRAASNRQQSVITSMKSMHRLFIAILVAACLSLLGCEYFPEASFELAPESRLPKWFTLPPGLSRSDVTVKMDYYVKSSGRTATFVLLDAKRQGLAEAKGTLRGLEPFKLKDGRPGSPPGYPSYEIVTVNGMTEIVEHRQMEPIFYITDDPAVLAELRVLSPPAPSSR